MTLYEKLYNFLIRIFTGLFASKRIRSKIRELFLIEDIQEGRKETLTLYEINQQKYNIGKHTHIHKNTRILNPKETIIGKYCSIADNCDIGVFMHPIHTLSMSPFVYCDSDEFLNENIGMRQSNKLLENNGDKKILIGNDVWIGTNAIIMNGIEIGDGAIVGASAVVTKDVPPYAIVVGIPAKIIKYRFDKDTIKELLELKWWDCPEEIIQTLPFDNIKKCIEILKNL